MSGRDLAMRALIVKCVADIAAKAIKDRRSDLADVMANGDRFNVAAPDAPELNLGKVWRTEPKGTAGLTDASAFTVWMQDNYPDRVTWDARITDLGKAIEVLREYAPELVDEVPLVEPWAEAEVLRLTERSREACGPAGETNVPGVAYEPPGPGAVTVKLSDDGPAVIEQLWREGRIDLTTGEVLAITAGESQ
ncbi:MAG TPA: hypothetical protein VGJ13_04985 [Pseudonocardiaceae bacterium]|jgi:hypothetical protein